VNEDKPNKVREFAIWWNNTFVLDFWYRQKYKIAFGSKQHRKTQPFDIMMEWEEEQIGKLIRNNKITEKQTEDYKKTGIWLNPIKSKDIPEDFYDNIDWDTFDDK
jgi:hypothetical protein